MDKLIFLTGIGNLTGKYNQANNINVDYQLDYIARLFGSISHKRFECYVIQRIWHLLNDIRIKFVVQQYIQRGITTDSYALADLYLPQLSIIIEINEAFHKASQQKIAIDKLRNTEISKITNCIVIVIDCTGSIDDVHKQIDDVINKIRDRIHELESKGLFIPWNGASSLTVSYHKQKGYLKVSEDEYVKTIDDICSIFNTKPIHRGFLRSGWATLHSYQGHQLWFASEQNSGQWRNEMAEDGLTITEYNVDPIKNKKHFVKIINDYNNSCLKKRVTFLKEKDVLGFNFYRFVGVFELDYDASIKAQRTIWRRCSDEFYL